ncbi:hypothetical protein PR048_033368 [Dryococelus australis]|uniref:Uncharacterized protein n=1 Tax=Dryococelus australis TaxID=614101 RepID=A0ABQ9G494_9NEOP|nr:hypothetical protein PR048_033368 [Dryococelus australis]
MCSGVSLLATSCAKNSARKSRFLCGYAGPMHTKCRDRRMSHAHTWHQGALHSTVCTGSRRRFPIGCCVDIKPRVIGAHNCEVFNDWRRVTQGVSDTVWSSDRRIARYISSATPVADDQPMMNVVEHTVNTPSVVRTNRRMVSGDTETNRIDIPAVIPEKFACSMTCRLDCTVVCTNMPISAAHWLSAVTVEDDDWASVLQEESNTSSLYHEQPLSIGTAVAERLACSPPTKAIRVQSPAGSPGFSHVGIVPHDAVGWWVFSGISRFHRTFIPAPLHTHLKHPHRLLRAVQISSLTRSLSAIVLAGGVLSRNGFDGIPHTNTPNHANVVVEGRLYNPFTLATRLSTVVRQRTLLTLALRLLVIITSSSPFTVRERESKAFPLIHHWSLWSAEQAVINDLTHTRRRGPVVEYHNGSRRGGERWRGRGAKCARQCGLGSCLMAREDRRDPRTIMAPAHSDQSSPLVETIHPPPSSPLHSSYSCKGWRQLSKKENSNFLPAIAPSQPSATLITFNCLGIKPEASRDWMLVGRKPEEGTSRKDIEHIIILSVKLTRRNGRRDYDAGAMQRDSVRGPQEAVKDGRTYPSPYVLGPLLDDKRRRSERYVGLYRGRCLTFSAPFTGRWRGFLKLPFVRGGYLAEDYQKPALVEVALGTKAPAPCNSPPPPFAAPSNHLYLPLPRHTLPSHFPGQIHVEIRGRILATPLSPEAAAGGASAELFQKPQSTSIRSRPTTGNMESE